MMQKKNTQSVFAEYCVVDETVTDTEEISDKDDAEEEHTKCLCRVLL